MFYNHKRQLVRDWVDGEESYCPMCSAPLVPKRGDWVSWHWAHYPGAHSREACDDGESAWHLRWKSVYESFGWQIEVPVTIQGRRFVLDAMNARTGRVREFVHSLNYTYVEKHRFLLKAHYDIGWIFDGEECISAHARKVRRGGMRRFLKPRPYALTRLLSVMVHAQYPPRLWKEWKDNVWFPLEGSASAKVLERYQALDAMRKIPHNYPKVSQ